MRNRRIANRTLVLLSIIPLLIVAADISGTASASVVIAHIDAETIGPSNMITRLPKQVEQILRDQKSLAQCFTGDKERDRIGRTGEDRFLGRWISLRRGKKDGLVVAPGSLLCGMGADIFHFWIFVHHGQRYRLVLNTYALIIDVLKRRKNGFHLIRITAHSANTEWRSIYELVRDGVYTASKCSQRKMINGAQGPWKAISCSASNSKPYR